MRGEPRVGKEVGVFDFGEGEEELGVIRFVKGVGHAGEVRNGGEATGYFGTREDLSLSALGA